MLRSVAVTVSVSVLTVVERHPLWALTIRKLGQWVVWSSVLALFPRPFTAIARFSSFMAHVATRWRVHAAGSCGWFCRVLRLHLAAIG